MVKLRIEGPPEEVSAMLDYLHTVLDITDESKVYPNRPPSRKVRVYLEANPAPAHTPQWLDVDGEPVHLLAAPDMSQETADALREVVRMARKSATQETITVRDLWARGEAGLDIESQKWHIDVFGKPRHVVLVVAPPSAGDYQVIYRQLDAARGLRSVFVKGDEVLRRTRVAS